MRATPPDTQKRLRGAANDPVVNARVTTYTQCASKCFVLSTYLTDIVLLISGEKCLLFALICSRLRIASIVLLLNSSLFTVTVAYNAHTQASESKPRTCRLRTSGTRGFFVDRLLSVRQCFISKSLLLAYSYFRILNVQNTRT